MSSSAAAAYLSQLHARAEAIADPTVQAMATLLNADLAAAGAAPAAGGGMLSKAGSLASNLLGRRTPTPIAPKKDAKKFRVYDEDDGYDVFNLDESELDAVELQEGDEAYDEESGEWVQIA